MTVCGFSVLSPAHAVLWADSEVFAANEPVGHRVKLGVNALAGVAMIGLGTMSIFHEAQTELQRHNTFDQVIEKMPQALVGAYRSFTELPIAAASSCCSTVGIVGYSHRRRRLLGVLLQGPEFEPMMLADFAAPELAEPGALTDNHAVIAAAQVQLVALRRSLPQAKGGVLLMAEVGPGGVRCGQVFDFERGDLVRWPRALGRKQGARR
jgi:hypothetical protein